VKRENKIKSTINDLDKLWLRQVNMKTEVVVIRGSQVVEETILLEEIRRNWRKMMV